MGSYEKMSNSDGLCEYRGGLPKKICTCENKFIVARDNLLLKVNVSMMKLAMRLTLQVLPSFVSIVLLNPLQT